MPARHLRGLLSILLALALLTGCDGSGPPTDSTFPNPGPFRVDRSPAWSPDGTKIAYHHDARRTEDTTDVSGLYVRHLETDSTWLVVDGTTLVPDWHPDGTRIAFSADDIFTVRPDGSGLRRLTNQENAFFPAWAPGGERLAYDTTPPVSPSGIWLANPDGNSRKNLGLGRDPDWSPEGGNIVHLRFLDGVFGEEVFVMDSTGSGATRLTHNERNDRAPAWSRNGEWIAWSALSQGANRALWIMRADGSDQQKLVDGGRTPAWGPDSERIVFEMPGRESDFTALWIVRRDGTGLRQITDPTRNPLN